MKRLGNVFDKIVSFENLKEAHRNASKGKGHYDEVIWVNQNADLRIAQLQGDLMQGRFTTSEYTVKKRREGRKVRTIHVLPYFPDRIVHHAIMQVVGERWESSLIRDTFQSLKGRGTSDARRRVNKKIQEHKPTYYLQMDVKKFYPSIKNSIVKRVIRRFIKCKQTLKLLYNIIDSVKGLPIGNYISQILGNLVLSVVDWFAKQSLKAKSYFRYCDDIVVLGTCKKWLRSARARITRAVEGLGLTIKPTWVIRSLIDNGLDFCGYVFYTTKLRLRSAIKERYLYCVSEGFVFSLLSYWGWIKPLNNKGLWKPAKRVLEYA